MTTPAMTPEFIRYKLVNGTAEAQRRQVAVRAAETAPELSQDRLDRVVSIFRAGGAR